MTAVARSGFTHVDERGAARMVDVTGKDVTARTATAQALLELSPDVVALLRSGASPKGDALAVARIAGILGAKRVPDLIPLCHPVALHAVSVELEVEDAGVRITASVRTADRTGVEMEAMMAAAIAGLSLYDMVKALDRGATLTGLAVLEKSGGRSGTWRRPR